MFYAQGDTKEAKLLWFLIVIKAAKIFGGNKKNLDRNVAVSSRRKVQTLYVYVYMRSWHDVSLNSLHLNAFQPRSSKDHTLTLQAHQVLKGFSLRPHGDHLRRCCGASQ